MTDVPEGVEQTPIVELTLPSARLLADLASVIQDLRFVVAWSPAVDDSSNKARMPTPAPPTGAGSDAAKLGSAICVRTRLCGDLR